MSRFEISLLITSLGLIFAGIIFYQQCMSLIFADKAGMPLNAVVPHVLVDVALAVMVVTMCVVGATLQGKVVFTLMLGLLVFFTFVPFFVEYVFEFNRTALGLLLSVISYFLSVICFFFYSNKSQKERETS